jgi:Tfp pilus assembly protein PilE
MVKTNKIEQGFTLVEVLVGTLIIMLFVVTGMQSFVSAVALKSKAKVVSNASAWIQENMQAVSSKAYSTDATAGVPYTATTLSAAVSTGATTITVTATTGFRVGDAVLVGSDSVSNVVSEIGPSSSPSLSANQIRLSSSLATAQSSGGSVIARCRAEATTAGYAAYLNSNLPAITTETTSANSNIGTKAIFNKTYTLTRSVGVRNSSPYQIAQMTYTVTDSSGAEVSKMSTEVIPNAYFQCP